LLGMCCWWEFMNLKWYLWSLNKLLVFCWFLRKRVKNGKAWFRWIEVNWWCCCVELGWMKFLLWAISFGGGIVWKKIEFWMKSCFNCFWSKLYYETCDMTILEIFIICWCDVIILFRCLFWKKLIMYVLD